MEFIASGWKDYAVIDAGDKEKLERWGDIILRRPDPQSIWPKKYPKLWNTSDADYMRSSSGGGKWDFKKKLPDKWQITYRDLKFFVRPTGFKHTGLFPEQAVNWDFMMDKIKNAGRKIKVLNLFAYTGGATLACLRAGAEVVHVDAAKSMVAWAKENVKLSLMEDYPVRFIVDDCLKFVLREQRRQNTYDAIIMDPPSYGRGADGQLWKLEENVYSLVLECVKLLSENPLFFIINSYTTGLSPIVMKNILIRAIDDKKGTFEAGEISLPIEKSEMLLPCGATTRWFK